MPRIRVLASVAVCSAILAACTADTHSPTAIQGPLFAKASVNSATADAVRALLDQANTGLEIRGSGYRAAVAEYITASGSGEVGSTILQKNVGNKRLDDDFVAFDPRRADWSGVSSSGDDITFAIDQTGDAVPPSTVVVPITAAQTTAAIRRAMASWSAVSCSTLPITEVPSGGVDIGLFAFIVFNGAAGSDNVVADVQHAGWRDANFAGGILAVTITFIFVEDDGETPTDINGNGLADVAFREIYYDPSWIWRVDGGDVDVESVALHEAGHGLSQGHFGNIFERHDGSFDADPRAVMNAFYQNAFRELQGSDNGGHCGNWGDWPNH